jgi:hypothetical protein
VTDWLVIATAAVGILAPFVKTAGDKFAEKAGESIFNLVEGKLKDDEEAESTLKNFEKNPDRHRAALADILREKAEADPGFGAALKKLVEDTAEQTGGSVTQIARGVGIAQASGTGASASVSMGKTEDQ